MAIVDTFLPLMLHLNFSFSPFDRIFGSPAQSLQSSKTNTLSSLLGSNFCSPNSLTLAPSQVYFFDPSNLRKPTSMLQADKKNAVASVSIRDSHRTRLGHSQYQGCRSPTSLEKYPISAEGGRSVQASSSLAHLWG